MFEYYESEHNLGIMCNEKKIIEFQECEENVFVTTIQDRMFFPGFHDIKVFDCNKIIHLTQNKTKITVGDYFEFGWDTMVLWGYEKRCSSAKTIISNKKIKSIIQELAFKLKGIRYETERFVIIRACGVCNFKEFFLAIKDKNTFIEERRDIYTVKNYISISEQDTKEIQKGLKTMEEHAFADELSITSGYNMERLAKSLMKNGVPLNEQTLLDKINDGISPSKIKLNKNGRIEVK